MVCEPKTNFKQGCNNCFCALDGSGFACTKMACPPDVYNEDGSLKPQPSTMGEPIVENASGKKKIYKYFIIHYILYYNFLIFDYNLFYSAFMRMLICLLVY